MKIKRIILILSILPMILNAENLVKNGDAEAGLSNWSKGAVQITSKNPHSGNYGFKTLGSTIISSESIPVDASKTYKISGWFKSFDDIKTNLYLGLIPLDANQKQIQCVHVNALSGTETELAEPCKPEDTVLKLKDASKWAIKDKYNAVAFETDNSGTLNDLPNSKITSSITKVEQKGTVWEVSLAKPCGKAYPANTPVRIQRYGETYMYSFYKANFQSPEWMEVSALVKGMSKSGLSGTQFWSGTKYVKILIMLSDDGILYFDDIKLEEVE